MKKIINTLSDTIEVTEKKSQYDQYAKRLLSNKFVLANILAECADEFRGMPVEEIVTCIDGDPEVSSVMVNPGLTNVLGISMEDGIPNEGRVFYDVSFKATVPISGKVSFVLYFDAELANNFFPGYPLASRIVFFLCRMISSQGDRDFSLAKQEYGKISKAYSIWIVFNAPKYAQDTITRISLGTKMQYGSPYHLEGYDLMEGIMICIPESGESRNKLISLLYTLFTNKLDSKKKKRRLKKEFGIRLTKEEEEVMESTNGLASYVWEKAQREGFSSGEKQGLQQGIQQGIEQGIEQGLQQGIRLGVSQKNHEIIMRMHQKGLDDETIAMYLDLSAEEVRSIIQKG